MEGIPNYSELVAGLLKSSSLTSVYQLKYNIAKFTNQIATLKLPRSLRFLTDNSLALIAMIGFSRNQI